jgi:hypothetical protein
MKTIFLDSEWKCHVNNDGNMNEIQTDFFDGKCDAFIEGYRFVPAGETWTRSDGVVFTGQMVAPWKDYAILAAYQEQYETTNAELAAAYQEGVNSID